MNSDTPVVFLHAFPLDASMWEGQRSFFGSRSVLTPNFPGFGGRPPTAPSLDHFAHCILAELDSAGIDRAVIVGLSMGGYVSFRLLALAPERVAGVVLADTRAGPDNEAGRARRVEQAERARREGISWLAGDLIPALLGETTLRERPEVEAGVRRLISKADPEGVARALGAMRDRADSSPLLPTVSVPVLVVVGEEDTLTPLDEAKKIADGVPDVRLVVIPRAGHLSNLENPEAFNSALAAFLG